MVKLIPCKTGWDKSLSEVVLKLLIRLKKKSISNSKGLLKYRGFSWVFWFKLMVIFKE